MSDRPPPPAARRALEPLKRALRGRFPEARFAVRESPDGLRVYLDVATETEDDFAVLAVIAGRTVDLFLRHGLQVHVFPFRKLPAD